MKEKKKLTFWSLMFNVFYYSTLFAMVYYIAKIDWGNLTTLLIFEKVGIVGGIYYLGQLFKKKSEEE